MIDRLFSLALLFSVLVGGTLAIGSELLAPRHDAIAEARIATLPRVVVTGRKLPVQTKVARADSPSSDARFSQ